MVDEETVRKVATLARINLTTEETRKFKKDLDEILEAFKVLEKAPTKGIEPSFQPLPVKNATRKDFIEPSLTQAEALANTKAKEKGYFRGPKVA